MPNPAARKTPPLTTTQLHAFGEYLVRTWETVRLREDAGPALKWCYLHLWALAGCLAGEVVITCKQLGAWFGVSHEAARHWIFGTKGGKGRKPTVGLKDLKWVDVIVCDQDGRLHLYIEDPSGLDRPRRYAGDPQDAFGFATEPEPEPPAAGPDTIAMPQRLQPQTLADSEGAQGGVQRLQPQTLAEGEGAQGGTNVCSRKRWHGDPDGGSPRAQSSPPPPPHRQEEEEGKGTRACLAGKPCADFSGGDWQAIHRRAVDWVQSLWPPDSTASPSPEHWTFLLRLAALVQGGIREDWVSVSIDATRKERRKDRFDYLKGTLANRLVALFGVAKEDRRTELDRLTEAVSLPQAIVAAGPPRPVQGRIFPAADRESMKEIPDTAQETYRLQTAEFRKRRDARLHISATGPDP